MFDATLQARFFQSCSQAAFGYATATTAAYAELTKQAFATWRTALEAALPPEPEPEPRSWYRHPDKAERPAPARRRRATDSLPAIWPAPLWSMPSQPAQAELLAMMWAAPWRLDMPLVATPMVAWMVAAGIPRSVAEPTAKANLAAMDAAQTTIESVQQVFASYRSESGHAAAQVIAPASLMKVL